MNPKISIIIPLFNEENRIGWFFDALEQFLVQKNFSKIEIIFVNDGSTDATLEIVTDFQIKNPDFIRIISYKKNMGKGYAVRQGMLKAKYYWQIFLDVDLSVPLLEINKLKIYMKEGAVVLIGSRNREGSNTLIKQSLVRRKLGGLYVIIANFITGANVSDFTCGFKCFSKEASEIIWREAKINRWSFDAEALFLARRYNIPIFEIGIIWRNHPDTRVSVFKDVSYSFFDLIRIRLIHRMLR